MATNIPPCRPRPTRIVRLERRLVNEYEAQLEGLGQRQKQAIAAAREILTKGTETELLAFMNILCDSFDLVKKNHALSEEVQAYGDRLAKASIDEWTNLAEQWFEIVTPSATAERDLRLGWKRWAETLGDIKTIDRVVEGAVKKFSGDFTLPLVGIAKHAKVLSGRSRFGREKCSKRYAA